MPIPTLADGVLKDHWQVQFPDRPVKGEHNLSLLLYNKKVAKLNPKKSFSPFPHWVWIGFLVLLALCVPWYFPSKGAAIPYIWGFPLWGAVMVGQAFLLAVFTAYVYLKVWTSKEEKQKR